MIRAVLFDVDGTLVDSNDLHATAWLEAFRRFGFDIPIEAVRSQIGKGGDNLIPSLLPELDESRQQELHDFRSTLFRRDYLPRVTPFPGIRPLFERLFGDGVRIVLATSSGRAELDFHRNLIGCSDLIHAATSKDDVGHSKPCPDIFEAALAKAAPVEAHEAIVVGDTPWDVKAAGRTGLRTVAVLSGGFAGRELREAGAAAIFAGPEALHAAWPRWLETA
jgi:HAD superfamily hydrolase (TIGR01509 family)